MARSQRGKLIWVTALTITSLLLGTGAINALAESGGQGRGGGQANANHAQTVSSQPGNSGHDGRGHESSQTAVQSSTTHGNGGHGDEHGTSDGNGTANHDATTTATTSTTSVSSDKHSQDDVERDDENDDDMVTPPGRVTEEKRPGLGCGDADDHTGAPGNPDKECKHPHDNDGEASTVMTADTDDDMVATDTDTDG